MDSFLFSLTHYLLTNIFISLFRPSTSFQHLNITDRISVENFAAMKIRLCSKTTVTHDTLLFTFEPIYQKEKYEFHNMPIGCHFVLSMPSLNGNISRPYTLVSEDLTSLLDVTKGCSCLYFLIKIYQNGQFTPRLEKFQIGDELTISSIKCPFVNEKLLCDKNIVILSAGTGITPFINLLRKVFVQDESSQTCVTLLNFNKTSADIIWKEKFDLLSEKFGPKFIWRNFLSEENNENCCINVEHGRVSDALLKRYLGSPHDNALVLVCGPPGFNERCIHILSDFGISSEHIFVFA